MSFRSRVKKLTKILPSLKSKQSESPNKTTVPDDNFTIFSYKIKKAKRSLLLFFKSNIFTKTNSQDKAEEFAESTDHSELDSSGSSLFHLTLVNDKVEERAKEGKEGTAKMGQESRRAENTIQKDDFSVARSINSNDDSLYLDNIDPSDAESKSKRKKTSKNYNSTTDSELILGQEGNIKKKKSKNKATLSHDKASNSKSRLRKERKNNYAEIEYIAEECQNKVEGNAEKNVQNKVNNVDNWVKKYGYSESNKLLQSDDEDVYFDNVAKESDTSENSDISEKIIPVPNKYITKSRSKEKTPRTRTISDNEYLKEILEFNSPLLDSKSPLLDPKSPLSDSDSDSEFSLDGMDEVKKSSKAISPDIVQSIKFPALAGDNKSSLDTTPNSDSNGNISEINGITFVSSLHPENDELSVNDDVLDFINNSPNKPIKKTFSQKHKAPKEIEIAENLVIGLLSASKDPLSFQEETPNKRITSKYCNTIDPDIPKFIKLPSILDISEPSLNDDPVDCLKNKPNASIYGKKKIDYSDIPNFIYLPIKKDNKSNESEKSLTNHSSRSR